MTLTRALFMVTGLCIGGMLVGAALALIVVAP